MYNRERELDIQSMTRELEGLVKKLRNNKEKVSEQLLKTKYKKPYVELQTDICKMAMEIVDVRLTTGLMIEDDPAGRRFLKEILDFMEQQRQEGLGIQFGKALCEECSMERFERIVASLEIRIKNMYESYRRGREGEAYGENLEKR